MPLDDGDTEKLQELLRQNRERGGGQKHSRTYHVIEETRYGNWVLKNRSHDRIIELAAEDHVQAATVVPKGREKFWKVGHHLSQGTSFSSSKTRAYSYTTNAQIVYEWQHYLSNGKLPHAYRADLEELIEAEIGTG